MRNHDSIVDAKPLIRSKDATTTLTRHESHHLLETQIATDTTDDQNLRTSHVRHSSFGDLDQHGVNGLLQREAEVLLGDFGPGL